MSNPAKSQNLSIMMTDIQGYTNTSSGCSREEIVGLIRRHNKLMIPVIQFYGGTVIKSIGDAFLCTFPSATDAVVCSIIIQLLLKEYNSQQKDSSRRLILRVVINTGDVSLEEKDIFGEAVNVTARMEGLECFPGGTIGISEATYLLMNRNEIKADKIGPKELKGIPEPVTVYQVPLGKQKLTSIPAKLLQLVQKAVNADNSGATEAAGPDLTEWSNAITSFLKEKNWGENVTHLQQKLVKTFGQKTVLEAKNGPNLTDAGAGKRLKSFAIDAVILLVVILALKFAWSWVLQPIVFGKTLVSYREMPSGADWAMEYVSGSTYYQRPLGITEWLVDFLVRFPALLCFLYFSVLWKAKGATLGQIASQTAVVDETGQPINWTTAFKRSALFLLSCVFIGLGAITLCTQMKKTLFDHLCKTRVIE